MPKFIAKIPTPGRAKAFRYVYEPLKERRAVYTDFGAGRLTGSRRMLDITPYGGPIHVYRPNVQYGGAMTLRKTYARPTAASRGRVQRLTGRVLTSSRSYKPFVAREDARAARGMWIDVRGNYHGGPVPGGSRPWRP